MIVHDTKSLYSKVIEVKHNLEAQVAQTGSGKGTYTIIEGLPQIHKVVLELIKIDIVWMVAVGDGYFMVTVSQPHRWSEQLGNIQHVIAKGLRGD